MLLDRFKLYEIIRRNNFFVKIKELVNLHIFYGKNKIKCVFKRIYAGLWKDGGGGGTDPGRQN